MFRVKEGFLDKVRKNDNELIKLLGFPTNDESPAATSPNGTNGTYQSFVNGQLYYYKKWALSWIYYTYGEITKTHNANGGTGGQLGFPDDDPKIREESVFQVFETDKEIGWNLNTGQVVIQTFKKYRCELYSDISDPIRLGLIISHGALDTGIKTAVDFGTLIFSVLKAAARPVDTFNESVDLAQSALKIRGTDITNFLKSAGGAAYNAVIDEYNTSLGPNGCEARTSYLTGRLAGEVLLILIPSSKLTAAAKIKILNRVELVISGMKITTKIGKFGTTMRFIDKVDVNEWIRIKAIVDANEKGAQAELFMKKFFGNVTQHDPLPTSLGDRVVDWYDRSKGYAHEIKMWKNNVSYSGDVPDQIAKDLELMNKFGPDKYRPVWHFLEGSPTQPLKDKFDELGIEYIIYSN